MSAPRLALVTGASGFIGAPVLPLLLERGFEVVAVSSSGDGPGQAGVRWRRCDLLDAGQCAALLDRERPSHLLHLAWIAKPGVFWSSPQNLDWLAAGVRLADLFYRGGGVRAVGLGSCAEYRITDAPCGEDDTPLHPETIYGKAKVAMYHALMAAAQGRGTYAWGRFFFPYGPREPAGRFVPSIVSGLLAGAPVDCTHGRQERDFIYVDDAAAACAALLDSERSGAYNIGGGEAVSLRRVAQIAVAQTGRGELLRFGAREAPPFDPHRIVADARKMRSEIGWSPRVGIEEGIRRTIDAARRTVS